MGWKSVALGSTALSVLFLAANAAVAAGPAAPAAGSLPGAFSSNSAVGYTSLAGSPTTATIATAGGNNVLQWGGTALPNKITAPSGITTNPGFSIGSGATLTINGGASSVLVTDLTGSPSQVFGALNASALGGPLFVSNTNGVIVGATGVITAPAAGVGLLGYAVDPTAFAGSGTVTVNNATAGAGTVTVASGATFGAGSGPVLVASNGTVNFGAAPSAATYVLAGYGFTTAAGSVTPTPAPTPASALSSGGSSVVNLMPAAANATITVTQLFTGGAANNSANLILPTGAANMSVGGVLTNSGVITETSELNGTIPGGLVNQGVINENALPLVISSTKGNVQNLGVLNVSAGGSLTIAAANVDLEGTVQVGGKAISSTNALSTLSLTTTAIPAGSGGVVDINTSLFSGPNPFIVANAIRLLSSAAITATAGNVYLYPGTNASAVSDPFYGIAALEYTMSVFPGAQVQATAPGSSITINNLFGGTSFGNSPGVNLDGTLSAPTINITANNINGAGGLSVPNAGAINLTFYGNVNNPHGAANNGSTAFQYNYLPVAVGLNGTKAGTATISLAGPSSSNTTDQNVNILVNGNVLLADGLGAAVAPTVPTAVLSSYANNHLVVSATGNVGLSSNGGATTAFYWPGFVYLASGITASNPTLAPNATASIALGDTSGVVNLTNLIPADLTTPDVSGQTGHGGVVYLTNNLNLSPATTPPPIPVATTTISNNSWVNFLTAAQAAAFSTASGSNFKGATITGSVVNTAQLPAADFQP